MSTRSVTMVVDRSHAEEHEAGFALKPQLISDKANVHMYLPHDRDWETLALSQIN